MKPRWRSTPDTMDIRVVAYDIDEEGNLVNPRDDTPNDMGRIAAQTFRQVLSQRIREAERDRKFEEYANREGDIVTGIVQQVDHRYTLLDLGRVEALLPQAEQVPFERPEQGARVKAYIVEVRRTAKGPQIVVSRTHPGLIKRLFELEVPEIADGIVEIKACAREPGHRTKIAVWSHDHNVDPVGACVGARGARVRMVVNELRGEKIDIVPFSEDLPDFVAKALSPAKVSEVRINEDTGIAEVIVPDFQLSLAIGKEGQNAPPGRPAHGVPARHQERDANWPTRRPASPGLGYEEGVEYAESGCVQKPRPARWNGTRPMARWSAQPNGRRTRRKPVPVTLPASRDETPEAASPAEEPAAEEPASEEPASDEPAPSQSDGWRSPAGPVRTCIGCRRRHPSSGARAGGYDPCRYTGPSVARRVSPVPGSAEPSAPGRPPVARRSAGRCGRR